MAEQRNQSIASQSIWTRVRGAFHGPVLVGVIAAFVAIALSVFGMVRNPEATPINLRSLFLVVVLAGGSWGLIAWAIATAAVEAGKDDIPD
ncbi:MAG: hypothetical protein HZB51_13280 [Chloroflexi bacterium]|nr:hypothetical protein [Chloroflexota bacterium]